MNNNNFYQIGILAIAIIFLIFIGWFMPFLMLLTLIIVPSLIALLSVKYSSKLSILVMIMSFMILLFFSNITISISFILLYFLISYTLIYCLKHKFNSSRNIFILISVNVVTMFLFLFIISNFVYKGGFYSLIDKIVVDYKNNFYDAINLYKGMNINVNNLNQIKEFVENLKTEYVLSIIPGNIIVISMIISFLIYRFTESQFIKNNVSINNLKPFIEWHIDDIFAAIIIGLISIGVILNARNIPIGMYLLNSSIIVGTFLFSILGISIVIYLFTVVFRVSKSMLIFIIISIFLLGFSRVFLILGISDSIINFRNLKYKNKS